MLHFDVPSNFVGLHFSVTSLSSNASSLSNISHQRSFLHNTFVKKAVHVLKGGTETTSERRAMKVLGIVFFVFLVAWLPFSILNILSAVCPSCGVQPSLLNLTSWLGYISSNLNPVRETPSRTKSPLPLSSNNLDHLHGFQCSVSTCFRLNSNLSIELLLSQTQGQQCVHFRRLQCQESIRLDGSNTSLPFPFTPDYFQS